MFTKELLAKYANSYQEIYNGKKLVIGPHIVVRGSQKNYAQFLNYNFDKKPDNIWFEDLIAKAILFKSAEKIYGVKPNAIGDMRYITVPYSLAWLGFKLEYKLDLYKIWKQQAVSDVLRSTLYEIMSNIEDFIHQKAPGSLFGEWAKKEECWLIIREQNLNINLELLNRDTENGSSEKRRKITDDETLQAEIEESLARIKSVHHKTWKKIEDWGRETDVLSLFQLNVAYALAGIIRNSRDMTDIQRIQGEEILNIVSVQNPELFFDMDDYFVEEKVNDIKEVEITLQLIEKIVKWDKKNKRLQPFKYKFMLDLLEERKELTDRNMYLATINLKHIEHFGFKIEDQE